MGAGWLAVPVPYSAAHQVLLMLCVHVSGVQTVATVATYFALPGLCYRPIITAPMHGGLGLGTRYICIGCVCCTSMLACMSTSHDDLVLM